MFVFFCFFFLFDFCIAEPDSPPQNVELVNVTATEIYLRWLPPEQPNGLITHYEVLYSDSNDLFIKNASSTSISLTELSPYTLYNITVRAFTRLGHGNQSSFPLLVRTSETGEYMAFKKILYFFQSTALWWCLITKTSSEMRRMKIREDLKGGAFWVNYNLLMSWCIQELLGVLLPFCHELRQSCGLISLGLMVFIQFLDVA